MLAIIATVGWIVFDVAISLATISDTMMPAWEWWVFLCGGVSLGLIALAGEILNHHSHAKEIGEILAGQESHLKEHDVLAKGNIAMLERLAAVTQTTGQSDSTVIEAAPSNCKFSIRHYYFLDAWKRRQKSGMNSNPWRRK